MAGVRAKFVGICTVLLIAGILGCGKNEDPNLPKRVPVEVKVMHNNSPAEGAHVTFIPQDPKGKAASGTTDAQGVAQLKTFSDNDGAVPGKYKITVTKMKTEGSAAPPAADPNAMPTSGTPKAETKTVDLLPPKYKLPASTPLEATVVDGQDNKFSFELKD